MKLIDVVNGTKALSRLSRQALPLRTSYQINKAGTRMQEDYGFFARQEQALLDRYKPTLIDGGMVTFESQEIAEEYRKEHKALEEMETDLELRTIEIGIGTPIEISAQDLNTLERAGILRIVGDDEDGEDGEAEANG